MVRIWFLIMMVMMVMAVSAEAQTVYVRTACTATWTANSEVDLAGYRIFAVKGATSNPMVTVPVGPAPQSTCAAMGVTTDGDWTMNLVAFDTANNASVATVRSFTRDTVAPNTTVTPTITGGNASFALASSELNSTFDCKLDTGAWAACISPKTYSALPEGTHAFAARATDLARNTDLTDAQHSWAVNSVPPVAPLGLSVVDVTP